MLMALLLLPCLDFPLVVPPSDPLALRSAMTVLADDRVASRLGEGARERFDALFTGERMCQEYLHVYERVLQDDNLPLYSVFDQDRPSTDDI